MRALPRRSAEALLRSLLPPLAVLALGAAPPGLGAERSGDCPNGDRDEDGVCDADDNCPGAPNPDQADADGDGEGDACECVPQPERCDARDNDCDGEIDEQNPEGGGACDTGEAGICAAGTLTCVFGELVCERDAAPQAERCNGLDDNCDGHVDELDPDGFRPCDTGRPGVCSEGLTRCIDAELVCAPRQQPSPEACNGLDDDCDALVDEGNPGGGAACNTGGVGACAEGTTTCLRGELVCVPDQSPGLELCDRLDNDCDGETDEDNPQGGRPCDTGGVGRCGIGRTRCDEGVLACDPVNEPIDEVCNGVDDDCDGRTDEDVPGVGEVCEGGACGEGRTVCSFGQLICRGQDNGRPETCNGADDDCDGLIDEDAPGVGLECQTGQPGACAMGRTECAGGEIVCRAVNEPAPEVCNGVDDDCDGRFDEDDPGAGEDCDTGQPGVCAPGRTVCRNGRVSCRSLEQPGGETCNGVDDDCDGRIDEDNPGGDGACDTGLEGECAAGIFVCRGGALECQARMPARAEICDGLDNDCDGETDEGDPGGGGRCATGRPGVCAAGVLRCVEGGVACVPEAALDAELCNGVDDDCDGRVDESDPHLGEACDTGRGGVCAVGERACLDGELACILTVQPSRERCNGADDDCDGETDEEDPEGGEPCAVPGARGACARGTTRCVDGAVICGDIPEPAPEMCNGVDDDCDGVTDEELPGLGEACDTGAAGACADGVAACEDGRPVCRALAQPSDEQCNGVDDDCDGETDEGGLGGEPCATGRPGRCAAGTTVCRDGELSCEPEAEAAAETCDEVDEDCDGTIDEGLRNACGYCGRTEPREACNGVDDDCDGEVDEGDLCPAGLVCVLGGCAPPCQGNECVDEGLVCVLGGCVERCVAARCPAGWACDDGRCLDPCEGVSCAAGEACHRGECVADTCYERGCPDGQRCAEGVCADDPCAGVECARGEVCRDGECMPSCGPVSCPLDRRCIDGECVADPCFGVECPDGQACRIDEDGATVCEPDLCADVACGAGRRCYRGRCQDDPCLGFVCPGGETCVEDNGRARCAPAWRESPVPLPDAGADAAPDAAPDAAFDATLDAGPDADGGGDPPDGRARDDARPDRGALDTGAPDVDTEKTDTGPVGGGGNDGAGGGCGCRFGAPGGGGPIAVLLLAGALALRPRRRRP